MPIDCKFDVQSMSKNRFHEIDYQVMRHAFDIQNEFGRLFDESIYHLELADRCTNGGFSVVCEGEIVVSHSTFHKSYFIDALIEGGAVYEFKALTSLNGSNESQLLNYMFLMGLMEGKLVNFFPPSVQHRFVSTTVKHEDRYAYELIDQDWSSECKHGQQIREIVQNMLADWGVYLDVGLYKEALLYLLGGEEQLLQPVVVCKGEQLLGHQKFHLLDQETLVHVSSTIHHTQSYQKQLERLIIHTRLEKIHWVNFSRQRVILTTLTK